MAGCKQRAGAMIETIAQRSHARFCMPLDGKITFSKRFGKFVKKVLTNR
jgi:hypothetical protein